MRVRNLVALVVMIAVAWAAWRSWPRPELEITVSGPPLVNVTVPALGAQDRVGEAAFSNNCAVCHGRNAAGRQGIAPPLVHKIYEPDHHGDEAFVRAAQRGVRAHHWPFGDMPPVKDITDTEIDSIIAYIRTLQRANGIR
ncbi:MAG: cytochrome c [Rhizobiaceae bacterium]|nr:cytochrome c [Rhizobiaceae bacterium]